MKQNFIISFLNLFENLLNSTLISYVSYTDSWGALESMMRKSRKSIFYFMP